MPRTLFSTLMLPTEGVYASNLPHLNSLPVRTFLPNWLRAELRLPAGRLLPPARRQRRAGAAAGAARISRRNALYLSLRGPCRWITRTTTDCRPSAGATRSEHDAQLADYLMKAVEQTRREFHIHSERVYLAGVAEGASVAYRMALRNAASSPA